MDITAYSLPVSLLRQHCFCPRIPVLNEVRKINPGDRLWLKQGNTHQEHQQMLTNRRNLERFGLSQGKVAFQVELGSKSLGLHGICDAVITTDHSAVPVEFKLSSAKPSKGHCIQLAAYGMLIEESSGHTVDRGFICFGRKGRTETVVLDQWRQLVLDVRESIVNNFANPLLPCSSASEHQCSQCEYLNFCADRF